jgi:hypothetical protein
LISALTTGPGTDSGLVIPAFYGPDTGLLFQLRGREELVIGAGMSYEKGTAFNRMRILSASGPLLLSIPVKKHSRDCPISEIRTDQLQKWQKQHWRSIFSAYGKSAYFGYYQEELESLWMQNTEYLAEFNAGILCWMLKQYFPKMKIQVNLAAGGTGNIPNENKRTAQSGNHQPAEKKLRYRQVFGSDFVSGLSIPDHLFCAGPKPDWSARNSEYFA